MRYTGAVRRLLAAAAVAGGVVSVSLAAPTPAVAATLPDLKVTAAVTPAKATYAVGDVITTTFTVTNVGKAKATDIQMDGGDEEGLTRSDSPKGGFDLAPGESHDVPWSATVNQDAGNRGSAGG